MEEEEWSEELEECRMYKERIECEKEIAVMDVEEEREKKKSKWREMKNKKGDLLTSKRKEGTRRVR